MDNEELKQEKGWKAQQLLDDEILNEALDGIEAAVIDQWEACPSRDAEGKELLWQLYRTSKKFRAVLAGYVESGKLATALIEQEKKGLLARIKDRVA